MTWLHVLISRVAALLRERQLENEISEDLRTHLEMLVEENVRQGMSHEEARYAARRSFGGIEQVKELYRDQRGLPAIESVLQDVRYGLRQLRRNPGFTAVAVITLALGIGATTAIFSVVNGVLLRPLPYPRSSRLVSVMQAGPGTGRPVSYPNFFDWQAQNHVFSSMATYDNAEFTLTGAGEPVHLHAFVVSSGLFQVLNVKPLLGVCRREMAEISTVSAVDPKEGRPLRFAKLS